MGIPKNINREHILLAIDEIDKNGFPAKNKPTRYVLVYNKKFYPPKHVLRLANIYANGEKLHGHHGGEETNRVLRGLGFNISPIDIITGDTKTGTRVTHSNVPINIVKADIDSEQVEEGAYQSEEGQVICYYGKRYERDPENRHKAIEFHGLNCAVCGFNFEKFYGPRGKNYIEVHHKKPLNQLDGKSVIINPESDLITVCSNCHRMLHREKNNVLTIDQLKDMINLD